MRASQQAGLVRRGELAAAQRRPAPGDATAAAVGATAEARPLLAAAPPPADERASKQGERCSMC